MELKSYEATPEGLIASYRDRFSPALEASVPAGCHDSPERRKRKIEFSGRVWKYSPSSTWETNKTNDLNEVL